MQFTPLTPGEMQRLKTEKKRKDKEKREMELNNRRHLANMRVVQKNLVYVIGLSTKVASEEVRATLFAVYVELIFNQKKL